MVPVERGVLDALGGHWSRRLLEAHDEVEALGTILVGRPRRHLETEEVVEPVEGRHAAREGASLRWRDGASQRVAIGGADRVRRGSGRGIAHVGPVHGKARDELPEGVGETAQREVAGGAMLLGHHVEAVAEHVQLGRHRGFHDEQLAAIRHLRKGNALADEAGVRLLHGRAWARSTKMPLRRLRNS